MISEFHFLRPEWFWAIVPLAGIVLWWYLRKLYKGNWSRVVDPQLQQHVLTSQETRRNHWAGWIYFIGGLLAITAMAGPAWERLPMPVFKDESALVIALDLSRSMNAQDIQPSRLQRARLKLIDILRQRRSGQTALIVYAADPYVVTPLTDDVETIIAHVPNLTTDLMPSQGSRADRAIDKAISLLQQAGAQSGDVLLITDEADVNQLQNAQARLRAAGYHLLILGVGTTEGAPIPEQGGGFVKDSDGSIVIAKLNAAELRSVAPYQTMSYDDRDINALLQPAVSNPLKMQTKQTELNTDTWRDQGPWLLLPVLLLALLGFRRGLLMLALCCLLPLPQPAHAFDWDSLWLNHNQRGVKALENKQADQAAKLFNNPEWKAAAEYRAGNYEQALKSLDGIDNTKALYNKANALAQLGHIDEAIATYNKVLEREPDNADAKYNRDLLQQQKQQQQQQSGNSNQNSEQDQNQQSQQQQQSGSQQQQQSGSQQQNSQQQNAQQQSSGSQQQDAQQQKDQQQSGNAQQSESQQQQNAEQNEQQGQQQQAQAEQQSESQQQQNAEQNEQQGQQQQAQAKQQSKNDEEQNRQGAQQYGSTDETKPDAEQQAVKQWLRRIPDDPGGLLRRKFMYQYRKQQTDKEDKQW